MANLTDTLVNGSLRVTGKIYGNVPTAPAGTSTEQIASTAFVTTAIDNLPEPMIFKGSLGTGGTITALPAAAKANEGFTYKVITAGTYASKAAKVGDTFISTGSAWELIPSGDEPSGTVTSVGLTGDGPITVTGSPVTSSGTLALSFGTTAIGNGGTGATTQQAAQYNIIKPQAATADLDNNKRFTFISENPSNTTQLIYYRTGSTVWSWIKGKLSSDTGVNISGSAASCTGNAATASAAKSGSALETAINGKVSANTAITSATKCKITYDTKGLVTAGADLAAGDIPNLAASKITSGTFDAARIPDLSGTYVAKNAAITSATKCKITYDTKGLVTAGTDLAASDIPSLAASKITSGTFDAARIPDLSAAKITSGNLDVNRLEKYSIAYHRIPSRDSTKDGKQWTRIAYKTISTYPTKSNWGAADAVLEFYQTSYSGTNLCNIGRLSIESHWGHNDVAEGGTPYSFKTSGTKAARWNNYNPTTISSVNYGTDNDGHIVVKVVCTDDTIEWWLANCIWDTGVTYFVRFKNNLNLYGDTTSGTSIKTNDEFNEYIKDKAVTNMTFGDGSVAYAANKLEPTSNYGRYKELTFTGVTWATFISAASVANSFAYKLFGSTFDDTERTVRCLGRLNISDSGNTIASTLGMGGYPQYEVYATRQVGYVKFSGSGKMAWYQFNRYGAIGSKITISGTAEGVAWSGVSDTPTTISGYGITDAVTKVTTATTGNVASFTSTGAIEDSGFPKSNLLQVAVGTCSTAADTAAKVATISDTNWSLHIGAVIAIKFSASNTASKCTLNVNSSGAKSIWYNNSNYSSGTGTSNMVYGYANRYTYYVYDGTYWVWLTSGNEYNDNTTTNVLARMLAVYCGTGAATAAKVGDYTNYALLTGDVLRLRMNTTNTADSPTMNVASTGAKPIAVLTASNTWTVITDHNTATIASGNYYMLYNGTNWYCLTAGQANANMVNQGEIYGQAGYAIKSIFVAGFRLVAGAQFDLRVSTANTSKTALQLNVNMTGAKPLYVDRTITSTSNYTLNTGWYKVYYDGENYQLCTSSNGKITYWRPITVNSESKLASYGGTTLDFKNGTNTTVEYETGGHIKINVASAPASDVSAWAKAASKPSYTATEVTCTADKYGGSSNVSTTQAALNALSTAVGGKQATLTFEGTYNASTNKAATVSTVTNAIGALDVTAITGTTTQTITSISETDGKVSVTYSDIATMGAATASAAGTKGLVPAPGSGKQNSFLRGDGTWAVPADTLVKQSVTTTSNYRPIILGYQNDTTHTTLSNDITQQVYATNTMYAQPSTGMIAATSYKVAEKATMQFNTTDNCVEFVF